MIRVLFVVVWFCCGGFVLDTAAARCWAESDWLGWRGMRVIEQLGRPQVMTPIDLDEDGRSELVVVNSQFSRLDVYHWLAAAERKQPTEALKDGPNDLPMAEEFQCEEIQLEHVPHGVVLRRPTGGPPEMLVLVASPNGIVSLTRQAGGWKQGQRYVLPPGEFSPRHKPMLLFSPNANRSCLLVSYADGTYVLDLDNHAGSDWLAPRESRNRADWWLADLDADGDDDLLEWSREAKESLRWYKAMQEGQLSSAAVLVDTAVTGAAVLRRPGEIAQPLVIDGAGSELLRRYELRVGESHPLGDACPLAIAGGRKVIWCGMQIDANPAMVAVDRDRPRLLVYALGPTGWSAEQSFPSVSDILAIAAPPADPGSLLVWAKDAPELLVSRWQDKRLSYPRPWSAEKGSGQRRVIALGSVGEVVWWAQLDGKDVLLWVWSKDAPQPQKTVFQQVSGKLDKLLWLGGQRILFRESHAASLKVAVLRDGKTEITEPAHLKKSNLEQFRVLPGTNTTRVARLNEGALQWLDDELQPIDQVMLPQGDKLVDLTLQPDGTAWALQDGGQTLHRLTFDANGVAESQERKRIAGGLALVRDPVLGLVLLDVSRLTVLREGPPMELRLMDVVDHRLGQSAGVKKLQLHRIDTLDMNGDGQDEILLYDDVRHQLTVLSLGAEKLETRQSWPVFEDKKYPYSDSSAPVVHEPRSVVSLDFDGDQHRDLALLCHDRLIVYLAKDGAP